MKNVYESVRECYENEVSAISVIAREWVEGFLRQKAWSGINDRELHEIWKQLRALQQYLLYTHHQSIDDLAAEDYAEALQWLKLSSTEMKINLQSVRRFFSVLDDFYSYLIARKLIKDNQQLQIAAEKISGGSKLNLNFTRYSDQEPGQDYSAVDLPSDFLQGFGAFPGTIEKVMLKIGGYFQRETYDEDFHRALYLYVGPLQTIPSAEDDGFSDFWIGFWDYFLFDYHLRQDDLTPIEHFLKSKQSLTKVEMALLQSLKSAQFSVFYIQRIVDSNTVECVNLLTDEIFSMPYPEFDYKMMKKLLFFGHVFSEGTFIANYIASIEVSANLRQRVKQELVRLKDLFAVQQLGSSWDDFLFRHCLAVRHTITLLTTFAKLNVLNLSETDSISRPETICQPDQSVLAELEQLMPKYGFSTHDFRLAGSMWHDYCQLQQTSYRKSGAWAAAIISCYALLNTPFTIPVEDLADEVGASAATIYANRRRLTEVLDIRPHDPRYLSEVGIIMRLYSS